MKRDLKKKKQFIKNKKWQEKPEQRYIDFEIIA